MVRIGAVQMGLRAGSALESGLAVLDRAKQAEPVDFLCFPGLALTGGMAVERHHIEYAFSVLREEAKWEYLVVGGVERAGELFQNNVYLVDRRGEYQIHQKTHPSPYEREKLELGRELRTFPTRFGRVGLVECAELMRPDITERLITQGAQAIFAIANWIYTPGPSSTPEVGEGSLDFYLRQSLGTARARSVPLVLSTSSSFTGIGGEVLPASARTRIVAGDGRVVASTREAQGTIYGDIDFRRPDTN